MRTEEEIRQLLKDWKKMPEYQTEIGKVRRKTTEDLLKWVLNEEE